MQLQDQVISLEQARKLQQLWITKPSILKWGKLETEKEFIARYPRNWIWEEIPAYTASELMDILPDRINKPYIQRVWWSAWQQYNSYYNLEVHKWDGKYLVWYTYTDWDERTQIEEEVGNTNLAQALWDMLIYLIENNLLPTTTNE